jgi:hypothetical protein
VTIGELFGEVLLIIFLHCLENSPQFWHTLVHVCQNWRLVVFASPRALQLRLRCKHGTPVLKTLGCWPALPIVLQYGGSPTLDPPSPDDENNVLAALKQSDRVNSISLTMTKSLLEKFSSIEFEQPFSDLQHFVLLSQNPIGLALPSAFRWGSRLRRLHSTGMVLPALPQLLSPSLALVDLQLHEVPSAGYFSPEEFVSALSGITHLQSLSLHFLSPASRPTHIGLSPSLGERVFLPALTYFKFRGASEYLNSLVTRINTPDLVHVEVNFFNQLIFHLSQLGQFIDHIDIQKSHRRADIVFSGRTVSIAFTQPGAHARLKLQISCEPLDWQLSSISQMCDHFFPFLSSIQDLRVDTAERSSGKGDVDVDQWLEIMRGFDGTKDLQVTGELAADILHALCPVDGEYTTVLPALHNLRVPELVSSMIPELLWEAVESFTTSRKLCGHPVQNYPRPPILDADAIEEMRDKPPVRYRCQQCDMDFAWRQGLTRHIKDKHSPRYMCPHCHVFECSQGRPYLFREHLEKRHPDIARSKPTLRHERRHKA